MCSTASRVMCVSEIRSHVFSYSLPKTNFSTAMVCKSWSDDALDVLWREVEGPGCLFQLLAPLELNEHGRYKFSRGLSLDDLARFDKYARRVHSLDQYYGNKGHDDGLWSKYDPTVFIRLATMRPRVELLPNLHILHYFGPPHFASMFLAPCLTTFCLTVPSDEDQSINDQLVLSVRSALLSIPKHAPHLQTLKVASQYSCVAALEVALSSSLSSLPALTTLHLPAKWLTKLVTLAIASHMNLHIIRSANPDCSDFLHLLGSNDVFSSSLREEDFPSLQELALLVPFARATACLSGAYPASNLTCLQVTSPSPDSPNIFGSLIEVVARRCFQLTKLELRVGGVYMRTSEQTDFGTISPLLKCTRLRSLDLRHPNPFILTGEDVISIVQGLPSLEYLNLNASPGKSHTPTLLLSTLVTLPKFCPNLHFLGLCIDATDPIDQITDIHIPRFPCLRILSVGRSPISHPLSVAGFLGRVLPAEARVEFDPAQPGYRKRWKEVSHILKVILEIREEQQQRCMADHFPTTPRISWAGGLFG